MRTKVCIKCNIELPLTEFYKQSKRKDYHPQCKKCRNKIWYREHKEKHPDKWKSYARKANKKKAGLPLEQFDKMVKAQNGLCKICGLPQIDKNQYGKKSLAIDHNHNTKKVRGLLCSKCNRALGLLDVDRLGTLNLQMAINYLTGTA